MVKIKCLRRTNAINSNVALRLVVSVALLFLSFFMSDPCKLLLFSLIGMNLYCALKCRDNNALFIVYLFLAWSNYSIYVFYWTDRIQRYLMYKFYLQFDDVMRQAAYSLFLFGAILFVACPKTYRKFEKAFAGKERDKRSIIVGNSTSLWMAYFFVLCIVLISGQNMSVRLAQGYMPNSALYEYLVIFFIIAFYLSSGNKALDRIISFLIIINCIYVFLNGERIAAIQFAIVFFLRFFMHKLSKKILFIGMIVGIIGLNAIGMWRGLTDFNVSLLIDSIKKLFSSGMLLDTAYSAEASGLGMIKLAQDYSIMGRLRLFFIYVMYIFVGSKPLGIESNLIRLAQQQYHYSTGGGVLPCFGLFYLGYPGVVLLGALVGKYLKMIGGYVFETSNYRRCLAAFIFASFMRWYLYSPSPLLRGALLFTIMFFIATKFKVRW